CWPRRPPFAGVGSSQPAEGEPAGCSWPGLAGLRRQPPRPVSRLGWPAGAQPRLVRRRLGRLLSVPGCPQVLTPWFLGSWSPHSFENAGIFYLILVWLTPFPLVC